MVLRTSGEASAFNIIAGAWIFANAVSVLMGVELVLNAANLNFVAFSRFTSGDLQGQLFAIFIIILAAAEVAVALAIVLSIYHQFQTIDVNEIDSLRD